MDNYILIGNIIAFISASTMIFAGLVRKKQNILCIQIIQKLTAVISNFILGSFSGMISNLIGCIRNVLCYKNKLGVKEKLIICTFLIIFTVYFNNLGLIGYLPLISTVLYTMFIDIKNITAFKLLVIVTLLMWTIHDLYIKSYVYVLFDVGAVIANLISICQIKKLDKKS